MEIEQGKVFDISPCPYCRLPVPALGMSDANYREILKKVKYLSELNCKHEISYLTGCSIELALLFLTHIIECAYAWEFTEEDRAVLKLIDEAFADVQRPEHFTVYTPKQKGFLASKEVRDADEALKSQTRESLTYSYAGGISWNPFYFSTVEAVMYFFPTMARLSLRPRFEFFGDQYASTLIRMLRGGTGSDWRAAFTPKQREAVAVLLKHIEMFDGFYTNFDRYNEAAKIWFVEND